MKKTLSIVSIGITLALAYPAINTVHATQTIQSADEKVSDSVLEHVLIPNVQKSIEKATALSKVIADTASTPSNIKPAFKDFLQSWKAVEASYVLGDLNIDYLDTPRIMDTYHHGNEKLTQQLNRALASKDKPQAALFKNSFKSIGALEYILFGANDGQLSSTQKEYAHYIVNTLKNYLVSIEQGYKKARDRFAEDQDMAVSYLLNALIDSAYKTAEWRIGDPTGLGKKYEGKPQADRQEYPFSHLSLAAISAILQTHAQIIGNQPYHNMVAYVQKFNASDAMKTIQETLTHAQQQAEELRHARIDDPVALKPLYTTLRELNNLYYVSLIDNLPIQARILDSDGD